MSHQERPILFSAPMVRAILEGRKTQTRRVVRRANSLVNGGHANAISWSRLNFAASEIFADAGPSPAGNPGPYLHVPRPDDDTRHRVYPKAQCAARLWVRETWRPFGDRPCSECVGPGNVMYAASADEAELAIFKFRPSIYMPRWASRILLEITNVRAQRVQDISEDDAIAEGLRWHPALEAWSAGGDSWPTFTDPRRSFAGLWDSINASLGYGWDANPWVWAISFRRMP